MMRLDRLGGIRAGFDDIRIQCSLRQPSDIRSGKKLCDFIAERIDEFIADGLALVLRICQSLQLFMKRSLASTLIRFRSMFREKVSMTDSASPFLSRP